MAPMSQKKRKLEAGMRGKTDRPKKRFRKQREYHSSSEDSDGSEQGFAAVNLNDSDDENPPKPVEKATSSRKSIQKPQPPTKKAARKVSKSAEDSEQSSVSGQEEDSDGEADSEDDGQTNLSSKGNTSKRNNPSAFSTSIAKILSTKLPQSARQDPVLSRSREAVETSHELANERLERKARAKLRAEKKEELDRGRIKDILGLQSGQAGEVAEEEKRLRKIAQRGVIKLFNAVRAAQVKAEQAEKEERKKGTIGIQHRQEKVNEMSKQGFLDLIGGKKDVATTAVH
ncbi:hypothetical protein PV10_04365 [Exophiala mesophila]|uniref:Ribosomal RNA-processing protein 15 n=1 Tax=Exophiala mesophila TaxID=212818 RepID=A0A0D1XY26_EXOME|nr:uncharacterized protein PV10_04365 [Exophiala mesophila]KIV93126.1 hypothetical protein PV10_04365 [Exophiala mesophila]